jgi:hypothetical protein
MDQNSHVFNSGEEFVTFISENEGLYKEFPEFQVLIKVWNSAMKSCGGCRGGERKKERIDLLESMYANSMPETPDSTKESIIKYMLPLLNKEKVIFKAKDNPDETLFEAF